jgi:hypothetical protein
MRLNDQSADGCFQLDDWRWISSLAAFNPDHDLIGLHSITLMGIQTNDASGDPTADHGVALGDFGNASESEHGFLEVVFFGFDGFDAEVFDAVLVENDGVAVGVFSSLKK